MKDADNIVLEARDESDTTKPGRRYVRERKITSPSPTSAWLPWRQEGLAIVDNGGGDISVGISGSAADMVFGLRGTAPTSFFAVNTKADGTGTNALRVDKDGTVSFGGTVSIPTTPTDPNAPASKSYVDTGDAAANANANNRVLKSGDTITGNLGVTGYIYGAQHGAGAAGTEIPNAAWVRGYAQPYDPQLFAGIPTFSPGNGYVTVGTDSQKCIWMTGGVTINSGAHPVNACITFIAWGGNLVIANNANMYSNINQTFSSGSRTLLQGGIATAIQFAGGYWIIAGNGLQ
jgi:hypothetical protein